MRAFSFPAAVARRSAGSAALIVLALSWGHDLARPPAALAQFPARIEGRVVDGLSRRPVAGARVSLEGEASPSATSATDASGRFSLGPVERGRHVLLVHHPGYLAAREELTVEPGRETDLEVTLEPSPVPVAEIEVRAAPSRPGAVRIEPGPAAAGSLGDLLRDAPGVVVRQRGTGGPTTISIRGSAPDEVLVLLDGVPLNDPITGEADLSLVPSSSVSSVVVLPGARSARYGDGAQGGVVLVETRGPSAGGDARVGFGSLGTVEAGLSLGGTPGEVGWSLEARRETSDGAFGFRMPAALGGGEGTRRNADSERKGITGSLEAPVGAGELSLRLRADDVRRGLPGRSFAPSLHARQEDRRLQAALSWGGRIGGVTVQASTHGTRRRGTVRDPEPPLGLPYHDRTEAWSTGARVEAQLGDGSGGLRVGTDLRVQGARADGLREAAPARRLDAGAFLSVGHQGRVTGIPVAVRLTGRMDRAGGEPRTVPSHEVALSATPADGVAVHLSHRSAFNPPALADLHFRSGVGIEPNPDLRGERVPGEVELGVSSAFTVGSWSARASLAGYRGTVRDQIEWAPDFRFVWSPRNVDVVRSGLDLRLGVRRPFGAGSLGLSGSWSRSRVTYHPDEGRGEDVQLRYRPLHSGAASLSWDGPLFDLRLDARRTGPRYPVPARVNELPGFWALDLAASASLEVGGWAVQPAVRIERLLDRDDTLIFGFPHPGRTAVLRLRVATPRAPS